MLRHVLVLAVATSTASAQPTGPTTLEGTVRDRATCAAVAGATLTLSAPSWGIKSTRITDERGHFVWPALFPMIGTLEVRYRGYTETLDIRVKIGKATQTLEIGIGPPRRHGGESPENRQRLRC